MTAEGRATRDRRDRRQKAEERFDADTLTWPAHREDEEPDDAGPWLSVYLGSAGVVWALERLGSERRLGERP